MCVCAVYLLCIYKCTHMHVYKKISYVYILNIFIYNINYEYKYINVNIFEYCMCVYLCIHNKCTHIM